MSTQQSRPKSTLAAAKFTAATRPIGWAPDPRAAARTEPAPMMGVGRPSVASPNGMTTRLAPSVLPRRPVTAKTTMPWGASAPPVQKPLVTAPAPESRPHPSPAQQANGRAHEGDVLVTSLVTVFILLAVAVASVRVTGNVRLDRSEKALGGTFERVFEAQGSFRMTHQRFATWPELERRGAKLGPRQQLVASNASASHWFISVRDTSTGIVCSRTGELFDEGPEDRKPSCIGGR